MDTMSTDKCNKNLFKKEMLFNNRMISIRSSKLEKEEILWQIN